MTTRSSSHKGLPLYLVPIMLGLSGILFARQLPNPLLQTTVVLLSVAAPLFVGGHLLARMYSGGYQRMVLVGGAILLILGAMVTVAYLSEGVVFDATGVPDEIRTLAMWLGLVSLLLGMFAVLFTAVGREEEIGVMAQRLSSIAEQMSEGLLLISSDGTITLANRRLLDMTGLREGEVVGHQSKDLAERLELDTMMPHIESRTRGVSSEYRIEWTRSGRTRQFMVSGSPLFDRQGRYAGTLATLRDVTDQYEMSKRLERYTEDLEQLVRERTRQLHQSETRLRELLLTMNEGFVTVDGSFHIVFANESICALLHVDREDLIGADLFDYVSLASRGKLLRLFDATDLPPSQRASQEIDMVRAPGDANPLPVLVAAAPVRSAAGEHARYSLVVADLREQKRMQSQLEMRARELEEANEELRSLDRAKDSFLANVSHELRTPLSTVRGYVEMLDSGSIGPLSDAQQNAIQVMSRNIDRLGRLIEEMLEFTRMETRGVELTKTLVSMRQVVAEGAASAKPDVLEKSIKLDWEVAQDVPYVWADRKRIAQVLAILLSNAVKFTGNEGKVHIGARQRQDGAVELTVSDTGIGIEQAHRKQVFDKFYQVDSSMSRRYQGAGIGLSIAKSVAEAHGGHIELHSEPGKGSTFSLVLPEAAFESALPEGAGQGLAGVRVLLVTDEPDFADALGGLLRRLDCRVTTVSQGYGAVRFLKEEGAGLAIIDEVLPDLTGGALVGRLESEPAAKNVPALLLTGSESAPKPRELLLQGARYILAKPFRGEQLVTYLCAMRRGEEPELIAGSETSAETQELPRVLVVDSDTEFVEWLETALRKRRIVCRSATDMATAKRLAAEGQPDFIFVDAHMREDGETGLEAMLAAAGRDAAPPVYAFLGVPGEEVENDAVAGSLRKPFSIKEMARLIQHRSRVNGGDVHTT